MGIANNLSCTYAFLVNLLYIYLTMYASSYIFSVFGYDSFDIGINKLSNLDSVPWYDRQVTITDDRRCLSHG